MTSRQRVAEAQHLLTAFGMDPERCNERSALTLLALLGLRPDDDWADAASPMLGTRAIMDFIRDAYAQEYAPNTRETIRSGAPRTPPTSSTSTVTVSSDPMADRDRIGELGPAGIARGR